jgi:hypothetical protein
MRKIFNLIILSFLFLIGCQDSVLEPSETSDAELIQMIIEANKIGVSIDDLPANSRNIVIQEYSDYMEMNSKKANGLGYEVDLAGLGYRSGQRNEIYFGINGRKLDPNNWGVKSQFYYDKEEWDKNNKEDWSCFELVFPISFTMPDATIIIVNSDDEEGWRDLKTWYDSNSGSREKPVMEYPIVIFLEEESIIVNNDEELKSAYSECDIGIKRGRDRKNRELSCFELVYPISFTMPDGSTTRLENDENGWLELKSWYEQNPGYEELRPEIEYPFSILYEMESGDSTSVINSEEEMVGAKDLCQETWYEADSKKACFRLVYPISFIMPDGSAMMLNDHGNSWIELKNWYEENPGYEELRPEIEYPVTIVYEIESGDSTSVINTEEEMVIAKDLCRENWIEGYE